MLSIKKALLILLSIKIFIGPISVMAADQTTWKDALLNLVTLSMTHKGAFYNKVVTSLSKSDELVKNKVNDYNQLCQNMKGQELNKQQTQLNQAWRNHLNDVINAAKYDDQELYKQVTLDGKINLRQEKYVDFAVNQFLAKTIPQELLPMDKPEESYAWSLYNFSNNIIKRTLSAYPINSEKMCQHDKLLCKNIIELRNCFYGLRDEATQRLNKIDSVFRLSGDSVDPRSTVFMYEFWSLSVTPKKRQTPDSPPQIQLSDKPGSTANPVAQ